jgi:hypothetical protein
MRGPGGWRRKADRQSFTSLIERVRAEDRAAAFALGQELIKKIPFLREA